MSFKVAFISSREYMRHRTPAGHVEQPARIGSMLDYLEPRPVWGELEHIEPESADRSWVETIHRPGYVDSVQAAAERAPMQLDPDTAVSDASYRVALLAVGALLRACDEVFGGRVERAFCAVRPPGHHAEADRAMGFCLFNNVAIAARYLQRQHGVRKIFIIDWDVHHGNGTQHAFDDDATVFYFSVHQWPFYPGTGSSKERGVGEGTGTTLNVPLVPGQSDVGYIRVFELELLPAIERFQPQMILISAGFDAHRDDPLGGMAVTEEGFAMLTKLVSDVSLAFAGGRIISVLEGGYNLEALSRSVESHLGGLLGSQVARD